MKPTYFTASAPFGAGDMAIPSPIEVNEMRANVPKGNVIITQATCKIVALLLKPAP